MARRILITGGAGYIGSHMVKRLAASGYAPTTFDNLSRGHRDAVTAGEFVEGDLLDRGALDRLFGERPPFDAVMHFAARAYVGESVADPRPYYQNNVLGSLNLLDAMQGAGADKLIFSSTCAVYGPADGPITEELVPEPVNPYGRSKLAVERAISDYAKAYGLACVTLRYFNAAGADLDGELSERHEPETHLIPLVLREALRVQRGADPAATELVVLGDDYPTPDGTCVRDYIHVGDLCAAHLLALERVLDDARRPRGLVETFNLGTETSASVLEVIAAARRVTGIDVRYRVEPRRPGDPPALVCSAERARRVLQFRPEVTSIDAIVASAWRALRA